MIDFLIEYLSVKYADNEFTDFVYVAVKQQRMYYILNGKLEQVYIISTAEKGPGTNYGSFQTPVGLHIIKEKVGDDVPPGGIIKEKVYTGLISKIENSDQKTGIDIITTRVLHLKGLETGLNEGGEHDSYSRGIFIHGTHEEGLLGKPASKGCIRMANSDIIRFYEISKIGMPVIILNN